VVVDVEVAVDVRQPHDPVPVASSRERAQEHRAAPTEEQRSSPAVQDGRGRSPHRLDRSSHGRTADEPGDVVALRPGDARIDVAGVLGSEPVDDSAATKGRGGEFGAQVRAGRGRAHRIDGNAEHGPGG
jgi:hypothetical protein